LLSDFFKSIHASLTLSHASRVSAVRTMRPLERAVSKHDITLDGLLVSRSRKSATFAALYASYLAEKA
jgi:hypothetical protein